MTTDHTSQANDRPGYYEHPDCFAPIPISMALRGLAAEGNHDGEPYAVMRAAADEIDRLAMKLAETELEVIRLEFKLMRKD